MRSFSLDLIARLMRLRKTAVAEPNIDPWRFGTPPAAGAFAHYNDQLLIDGLDWIVENTEGLDRAADLYYDLDSRDLLTLLICFRLLGPRHVRLPRNSNRYFAHFNTAGAWRTGPSARVFEPFEFSLYRAEFQHRLLELECWLGNIVYTFLVKQYFLKRSALSIGPAPGDYIIDAGGCFGDTALAFAVAAETGGRIFSFEPVPRLQEVLTANIARNPALSGRIKLIDLAVSDASGARITFRDAGAGSGLDENGGVPVTTITIDDFVSDAGLPRVDFIKMDIEGGERPALAGAAETMRRFRPTLAISAYHRPDDLLVIPALIKQIEPAYDCILEQYTLHNEESVVFAVARRD